MERPLPIPTPTSTPIPSSTLALTPTASAALHPLFLFDDVIPQVDEFNGLQVEIIPTSDFTNLILRFTRPDGIVQESSIKPLIFGEEENDYPAIGGVTLVAISDLNLDGEPEVVLDIFTHGASCCTLIVVLYYDTVTQQYTSTHTLTRKWGLAPQTVDIDGDNRLEFLTRNEPFHYVIGGATVSAAISPIQILRYEDQAIVDVTEQFPELVEQDAQLWLLSAQGKLATLSPEYLALTHEDASYWRDFDYGEVPSLIMDAYLADMLMLGRGSEGCEMVKTYYENDACEICAAILSRYEDGFCPKYLEEIQQYLAEATFESSGSSK